jgi:hypothetical protein
MVKPVPLNVAELITTAVVPVEVNLTSKVDGVLSTVFPNARLDGLINSERCVGFSSRTALCDMPFKLAVNVTD